MAWDYERPGVAMERLRNGAGRFGLFDLPGYPGIRTGLARGYFHDAFVDAYLEGGAAVKERVCLYAVFFSSFSLFL